MLERDRLALKKRREEQAAEETAEREERERPIRELEEKMQQAHRELARIERERLTGKVEDAFLKNKLKGREFHDPDLFVDERTYEYYPQIVNDPNYKTEFNRESIRLFRQKYPEVYWSEQLVAALGEYFDRHELELTSVPMLEAAVARILNAGLAPKEPPAPEPVPEPDPFEQPMESMKPVEPEYEEGWDTQTGERRVYSRYEINKMSAEMYLRCFRLSRAEMHFRDNR